MCIVIPVAKQDKEWEKVEEVITRVLSFDQESAESSTISELPANESAKLSDANPMNDERRRQIEEEARKEVNINVNKHS